MTTKYTCSCCSSDLPISKLEFENLSFVSTMTGDSNTHVDNDTGSVTNTVTDASSSSSTCVTLNGDGKPIWDGKTVYTVQDVYLGDIVEETDKNTIRRLTNLISKVIFPNEKFLPNWNSVLTLTHDVDIDTEEKDGDWLHHLFGKMSWGIDCHFLPFHQAIKWNTYKHAFIHHFNNYRATNIAKVKKHLLGGKFVDSYLICKYRFRFTYQQSFNT